MKKNPAAVALGRRGGKVGGKSTSPAKQAAVRANVAKARDAKKLKFAQHLELDIFYAKLGKRPKCGRCQKFHTKKQLNICDDGIASGDQRDYVSKSKKSALDRQPDLLADMAKSLKVEGFRKS